MAFADAYRRQVALLIRTVPSVAAEECFAMKGGTAINLFVRDRLSVDIDLTYLPVQDRAASLAAINAAMLRIGDRIMDAVRGVRVAPSRSRENVVTKLVVRGDDAQIKIEVTPVLRGCVFEPEMHPVSPARARCVSRSRTETPIFFGAFMKPWPRCRDASRSGRDRSQRNAKARSALPAPFAI